MYIVKQKTKFDSKLQNNIIGTVVIKGIAMMISLLMMPSYIKYYDNQAFLGVWFSIVSLLQWILTFDLGIGNGLRNQLVPALLSNNRTQIKKLISSSYAVLGIFSLIMGIIGFIFLEHINFNVIFNISKDIIDENTLLLGIRIVFIGVILQFFLKIITSIFYAMQKTVIPNILTLISSITIFIFINIYRTNDVTTNFIALSYAQVLTVCIPLIIATIVTFKTNLRDSKPNLHYCNLTTGKNVIGLGGKFFIVQICLMIITSTNEMLINFLTESSNVVEYQIYNRVFYMIVTLFALFIQPMWSAFAQANVSKNYVWMAKIYRKFKFLALMGTIGSVILSLIFQDVVNFWLGKETVTIHFSYSLWFAILVSIMLFINSATSLANAMNELKTQIIWSVIGAIIKIPLSFILVKYLNTWIGVVIANIIVLAPLMVFQLITSERSLKNKLLTLNQNLSEQTRQKVY